MNTIADLMTTKMEMQSKNRWEKPHWGEPTTKIGDTLLVPSSGFTPLLIADNDIKEDGDIPFFVGGNEFSLSFDVKVDKATLRSLRKFFKHRIPRKKKKAIKKEFEKRFGVKVKKFSFNNSLLRHGR